MRSIIYYLFRINIVYVLTYPNISAASLQMQYLILASIQCLHKYMYG